MNTNTIIIDDFYENVDEVRSFALSQPFDITGNFPGKRTVSFADNQSVKSIISQALSTVGKITYWPEEFDNYNGSYQITTAGDRSWIHCDSGTTWAGVCYLTPDAPLSSGTGFYKHKETGLLSSDINWKEDAQDVTKWELVSSIGNVYNRLILYRGNQFHASMNYFGENDSDGRLFQTFFFDTE
tara:strand:+ start:1233 stop:1784 length:552 start_codon:yes stop_codon:yes gene_type:complete